MADTQHYDLVRNPKTGRDERKKVYKGKQADMVGNKFDFVRFIDELPNFDDYISGKTQVKGYSVRAIEHFNDIVLTFNPLWLIATNPHFRGQFEVFNISDKVYTNTSFKFKNTDSLITQLVDSSILPSNNVDEITFSKVDRMLDLIMIDNFIDSVELPVVNNEDGNPINLKTVNGRKEFIDLFVNLISSLRKTTAFRSNYFITNLIKDSDSDKFGNRYYFYKIDEANVSDTTTDAKMRTSSLKQALSQLNVNVKISANTNSTNNIYNMIRIYNLLVHRDSVNSKSFTQYFPFDDISKAKALYYKNISQLKIPDNFDRNLLMSLALNTKAVNSHRKLKIKNNVISIQDPTKNIYYNKKDIKELSEVIPTTKKLIKVVKEFTPDSMLENCVK